MQFSSPASLKLKMLSEMSLLCHHGKCSHYVEFALGCRQVVAEGVVLRHSFSVQQISIYVRQSSGHWSSNSE